MTELRVIKTSPYWTDEEEDHYTSIVARFIGILDRLDLCDFGPTEVDNWSLHIKGGYVLFYKW